MKKDESPGMLFFLCLYFHSTIWYILQRQKQVYFSFQEAYKIKVLMQMGQKPSQKKINQMMRAMNNQQGK